SSRGFSIPRVRKSSVAHFTSEPIVQVFCGSACTRCALLGDHTLDRTDDGVELVRPHEPGIRRSNAVVG
ncbi:MAG TPA: hypothetical protein VM925_24970, partial [Labilithrix sp.]|nr:hypothetical protein [Labilithrix sp.]